MPVSLDSLLPAFQCEGIDIDDFIHDLFTSQDPAHNEIVDNIGPNVTEMLESFVAHPTTQMHVLQWCRRQVVSEIQNEVVSLAMQSSGLHFNAKHVQASQVEDFTMQALADKFSTSAPTSWTLLQSIMDSSTGMGRKRALQTGFQPLGRKHVVYTMQAKHLRLLLRLL